MSVFPAAAVVAAPARVSTRTDARVAVVAVIGDARDLRNAQAFTREISAREVSVAGGYAWVHTPAGVVYGAVLACPGGDAGGLEVSAFSAWVLAVDPRAESAAATTAQLLAAGFESCEPPLVPVPVPPRWVDTTIITPTGWYHGHLWLVTTPAPLETVTVLDAHAQVVHLVPLQIDSGSAPTRLHMLALWDPTVEAVRASVVEQSDTWQQVPIPAGSAADPHLRTLRAAAGVLRARTAHLLGAPVVTGVDLPDLDAIATVANWEAHLPGDIVDEIVETLWAADRDDLLPGGTAGQ